MAIFVLANSNLQAHAEPMKIGVSLPLGSNAAKLASQFQSGMEWYIESKSLGQSIELVIVDDGCDKDLGLLAAEDLLKLNVVLAMGYFCSESAAIAAEIFADAQIPLLVNIARSERLMKDRNKEGWNLWRVAPGDDYPAVAAFEALSKRWRNVPFAVVDDGTIYGRTLVDEFRVRMEEAEIPPLYIDNFRASQSTQAGLIRRLQRSGVKAAFIGAASDDFALVAQNISELGANFEIAGGEVMNVLPYLYEGEPVPAGLLAILQPEPDQLPSVSKLKIAMQEAGIEPEPYFFEGYAAMQLAHTALAKGPQEVTKRLENGRFGTVLGPVKFDKDGKNITNNYALYRWDGTKFDKAGN